MATRETGSHDVIDILTEDHHAALDLLQTIEGEPDPQRRKDTVDTITAEIVRHSVAEETFVYPAMRDHLVDGDDQVAHDVVEHKQLETTLKQLEALDGDDPRFFELVVQLEAQLRDHADDEEVNQFPALRAAVPAERLQNLGRSVELAKQVAPTRPHPAAPNAALFHATLGAGVGFVDKVRDALSGRSKHT